MLSSLDSVRAFYHSKIIYNKNFNCYKIDDERKKNNRKTKETTKIISLSKK